MPPVIIQHIPLRTRNWFRRRKTQQVDQSGADAIQQQTGSYAGEQSNEEEFKECLFRSQINNNIK